MAEAVARLMNYPTSPRKMRYVADIIRGMDAEKAVYTLKHASKAGAKPMEKLLRSAIDNWEKKNGGQRVEDAQLYVKMIWVDGGTTLKRWLPAPQGRAYKLRKRSNHITIIVDSKILLEQKAEPPAEVEQESKPIETNEVIEVATEAKRKKAPAKKAASKKKSTKKQTAKA